VGVGGQSPGAVVVGLGLNLQRSAYPEAIADRATSVGEECDRAIERGAIVAATLDRLDREVERLGQQGPAPMLDDWRRFAQTGLDRAPVRWRDHEGEHRGTAMGLAEDGALIVRRAGTDAEVRLVSGEVVWEMLTRE